MKKFFAAVCCTLLVASASFAQSGTRVAPAAEAMPAASDAAATVVDQAVMAAPVEAAPMTSGVVEGTVVNAPMATTMAPMATSYPMAAPIQQGCGCGGAVSAPVMSSAPVVSSAPVIMGSPDMSQSVVAAPVQAAPMVADCGCGTAAPVAVAAAPACCPQRERRQPVRGLVSRLGSRRNNQCCN